MSWYHNILDSISNGLLLSGMIVGTWEFGEFLSLWWGRWGPTITALLVPWGLLLASFSHIPIPLTIYVIGVGAVWLWEPGQWHWKPVLPSCWLGKCRELL